MMAKSVLIYKEQWFWVPDLFLEVLYCLMLEIINNNLSISSADVKEIIDELKFNINGYFPGAIDLDLDKYSEENIKMISKILLKVKDVLLNEHIDFNHPNILRNKVLGVNERYFKEWETVSRQDLLKLVNDMLLLIGFK